MQEIQISRKMISLVDDGDYDYLNQFKYFAVWNGYTWYARRTTPKIKGVCKVVYMHRDIMNPEPGFTVDHRDSDGLHNFRSNLRVCTPSENSLHRGKQSNNLSGYKGVGWMKSQEKWRARITIRGVEIHLGLFDDINKAAQAYDEACALYDSDFSKPNF